jgi:hypothetical protein
MSDSDIEKLEKVFEILAYELGERILLNFDLLFPKQRRLKSSFEKSWQEIHPLFEKAREQVKLGKEYLEQLGLTGHQLEFKVSILFYLKSNVQASWVKYENYKTEVGSREKLTGRLPREVLVKLRSMLRTIKKNTGRLLEHSEIFMDSCSMIPGASTYLDPIKEIKASVETLCK